MKNFTKHLVAALKFLLLVEVERRTREWNEGMEE